MDMMSGMVLSFIYGEEFSEEKCPTLQLACFYYIFCNVDVSIYSNSSSFSVERDVTKDLSII